MILDDEEISGQLELFSLKDPRDDFAEVGEIVWDFEANFFERIAQLGYEEYGNGTSQELFQADADFRALRAKVREEVGTLTWIELLLAQSYSIASCEDLEDLEARLGDLMALAAAWSRHVRNDLR